jgi:hypothetical protein
MSKGSPRVTVRVPEVLLEEIRKEMASQEAHSANSPEDVTAFILRAIEQRIAKRRRSRAKRSPRISRDRDGWPEIRYGLHSVNG